MSCILICGDLYAAIRVMSLLFKGNLIAAVSNPGVFGRFTCIYGIHLSIRIIIPPPLLFSLSVLSIL